MQFWGIFRFMENLESKRSKMNNLYIAFLCFLSASVFAEDSVLGSWQGVQIQDGLPLVVDIEVGQLKPKDRSSKFVYAVPRSCSIQLEYAGPVNKEEVFYVVYTNTNSWCESAMRPPKRKSSHVKLKLADNGDLFYEFFNDGTRVEGGSAKRQK